MALNQLNQVEPPLSSLWPPSSMNRCRRLPVQNGSQDTQPVQPAPSTLHKRKWNCGAFSSSEDGDPSVSKFMFVRPHCHKSRTLLRKLLSTPRLPQHEQSCSPCCRLSNRLKKMSQRHPSSSKVLRSWPIARPPTRSCNHRRWIKHQRLF